MKSKHIPEKILITALLNLGDVVMCTAALEQIKKAFPGAELSIMVRAVARAVVENNPLFDEIIVINYQSGKLNWLENLRLIMKIRASAYDVALCLDQKSRSMWYCYLAGIPRRVLFDGVFGTVRGFKIKLATSIVKTRLDFFKCHISEHLTDIVANTLNITPVIGKVSMGRAGKLADDHSEGILSNVQIKQLRFAICAKSTFPLKDWYIDRWAELVNLLSERYQAKCVFVGGASDRHYSAEIIRYSGREYSNFCGQTSLSELALLLKETDMLVSVDTGTAHVAAAAKTPTVEIHGCTNPQRCRPYMYMNIPVWSMRKCSPCNKRVSECLDKPCIDEISVQDVLLAVAGLFYTVKVHGTGDEL